MPRVICDLKNASDEINGIKFFPLDDGRRISDEIDDATANRFASIPGYSLDEEDSPPATPAKPVEPPKLTKAQAKAAEKAAEKAAQEELAAKEAAEKAAADAAKKAEADKAAANEGKAAVKDDDKTVGGEPVNETKDEVF
jgi:type IV secretory pathway VirB10-like protein